VSLSCASAERLSHEGQGPIQIQGRHASDLDARARRVDGETRARLKTNPPSEYVRTIIMTARRPVVPSAVRFHRSRIPTGPPARGVASPIRGGSRRSFFGRRQERAWAAVLPRSFPRESSSIYVPPEGRNQNFFGVTHFLKLLLAEQFHH